MARYKGFSILGTPDGQGHLEYEWNSELLQNSLPHEIKTEFHGEFKEGFFKDGCLQFKDNSYYIGEFNPSNNKFHGMGRLTYSKELYYQGHWVNGLK